MCRALSILVIFVFMTGCAVRVQKETRYWSTSDRLSEYKYRQLSPVEHQTTRDDVLRIMGPPLRADEAQRVFAYQWETVPHDKAIPDWGNREPDYGVPVASLRQIVIFEFDGTGTVEKITRHVARLQDSTRSYDLFLQAVARQEKLAE